MARTKTLALVLKKKKRVGYKERILSQHGVNGSMTVWYAVGRGSIPLVGPIKKESVLNV